ncbi:MAG: thiol-activated cytolysin family protein [Cytophagales bacterium]
MKIRYIIPLLLSMLGCVKKTNNTEPISVDTYILQLNNPVQPRAEDTTIVGQINQFVNGDYTCTEKKVAIGYEFNKQVLLNPQSDVIYPGSIIDGNSVVTGGYRPLVFDRAPMKLSVSLEAISGKRSAEVQNPTLSSVRDGISNILNQGVDGATPSNMTFEYFDVTDERNLNVALGLSRSASAKLDGLGNVTSKVKSNLEYNSTTKKNKFLFRYVQSYYTVDVDPPTRPSGWFGSGVTSADLSRQITSNTAPVYVSSVNYGRIVYFCLSSDYSFKEVKAAWEREVSASIAKGTNAIDGSFKLNVSIDRSTVLSGTSVSGVVIGGNASSGATIIETSSNPEYLTSFIVNGANYSKQNPGLPIAYTLRKVGDNSVFKVVDYNEFIIRDCKKNVGNFKLSHFRSVKGDNDMIYGEIKVTLGYNSTGLTTRTFTAFAKDRNNVVYLTGQSNVQVSNENNDVFTIDPARVNEAFIRIDFLNFKDRDDGDDQDDSYPNVSVSVNYSDLKESVLVGSTTQIQQSATGEFLVKMRSTANNTKIGDHCCEQIAGICRKRCPSWGTVAQDAEFEIAFKIEK